MPPNATHLCQPLDVAVFRGLKAAWKKILAEWRIESRVKGAIPKENLPTLLSRLFVGLNSSSLISGFRATGIYPIDRGQVLKRLPGMDKDPGGDEAISVLNESVLELLKDNLGIGSNAAPPKKSRGPKVPAGQRITVIPGKENVSNNIAGPSGSSRGKGKAKKKSCSSVEASVDERWFCGSCNVEWKKQSDDVWIQCDRCDVPFHLQCAGFDYDPEDYYELNIEAIEFTCSRCVPSEDEFDEE